MTATSPDTDVSSDRQRRPATPAGARLTYDRTGRGEPLVLLHGRGFSRRCWDPIGDTLAAQRDVIAVDLPGHGDSPRQPKGNTGSAPHDLAVAVAELLDELGLSTAHVAGNSSGGWVPWRSRRHSERSPLRPLACPPRCQLDHACDGC
jgi:alpha-beta hydrolase superfamily lysophospholipase